MPLPEVCPKPPGRPKGVPNKYNQIMRNLALKAIEAEGGLEYFRWAAKNAPKAFLDFCAKMAPKEVSGLDGGPIEVASRLVIQRLSGNTLNQDGSISEDR